MNIYMCVYMFTFLYTIGWMFFFSWKKKKNRTSDSGRGRFPRGRGRRDPGRNQGAHPLPRRRGLDPHDVLLRRLEPRLFRIDQFQANVALVWYVHYQIRGEELIVERGRYEHIYMCVCEREREREYVRARARVCVCVCVCVCV
jgi:hypothetical protein